MRQWTSLCDRSVDTKNGSGTLPDRPAAGKIVTR